MINVMKEKLSEIPVLHIAGQDCWKEELPLIIFIHGFMSAKEHNLHYAYLMAEKGFRVILPDVYLHGERSEGLRESELYPRFWELVVQTINEIPIIKEELLQKKLIDPELIGIAGTSMGGIVTNGAFAVYDWLKVGVSLMGNPSYLQYAKLQVETIRKLHPDFSLSDEEINKQMQIIQEYDLSLQSEKLAGRPLFIWHGAKDKVVPYTHAYQFYQQMVPSYEGDNDKLAFVLDEKADHKVSREGILMTADWFEKHLLHS